MTRLQLALTGLVLLELGGAATLLYRRWDQPAVPALATSGINDVDLVELRAAHARAVQGGPTQIRALALAYFAQGMMADAESCYRAAAFGSKDPQLLFEWAFCLGQSGQPAAAVEQFQAALACGHPDASRCWYFIGQNELRQEHAEEAKAAFRQAEPLPAATYELAKVLLKEGNWQRAQELLAPLAQVFPEAYQPHYLLARAAQLGGDSRREALHADKWSRLAAPFRTPFDDEHERVTERANAFAFVAERKRCFELVASRQYTAAETKVKHLLAARATPDLADLYADIAFHLGRRDESLEWLQRAVEIDGPTMHAFWRWGDSLAETGRVEEARRLWDAAIRLGAGHAELEVLCTQVAHHYQRLDDQQQFAHYQRLALRAAGLSRLWRAEFREAIEPLENALKLDAAADPLTWFFLGEARRYASQKELAREAYHRCLMLDPNCGRAKLAVGILD